MTEKAFVEEVDGYPVLRLEVDGHEGWVFDPKTSLLEHNIVVIQDANGWWEENAVAHFIDDDSEETIEIRGGVQNEPLAKIVLRYMKGATGDLLN